MRACAVLLLVAALGACSTMPPPQDTYYFDEAAMAPLPGTPMVEYPPIEPVQIPPIEPPPQPAPVSDPATSSPATTPPPEIADPAPATPDAPRAGAARPPATQERVIVATAAPETRPAVPDIPPPDYELLTLMADLNRYSALGADDAKREIPVMTQSFNRDRSDANRVRLAVLYTLTRAPQDDLRAMQLLDNVAKSGGPNGSVKHLALVLQVQVSERTRAVRDETARANEAAQKLDALRQMERSLLRDRVSGGGGGGGGGGAGGGGGGH